MDKLFAIIRREYVETVRTKAFVMSTLLVPVMMTAVMFVPQLLARSSSAVRLRIGVADTTGRVFPLLDKELSSDPNQDTLAGGERRYQLLPASSEQLARLSGKAPPGAILVEMGADALLVIDEAVIKGETRPSYYATNVGDFQPIRRVEEALNAVVVTLRVEGTDISADRARSLTRKVDMKTEKVGRNGETSERGFTQEYFTAIFFTMGLYISTLMSGMALSRGLLEEKANRVVEVLVSSVTPFQLMTGKILGHAMVILSQFVLWTMMGGVLYLRSVSGGQARAIFSAMSPSLLGFLGVYFVLGYFLYAAFFSAVGAMCTTELEAQQTQTPLVLMQVFPLIIAMGIVRQPDSTMAVVLSMIPVFAPSVMMMRLSLQPPPIIQVAASLFLLVTAVGVAFWAVSKIFRVGILMTGKRMTLVEVFRWIRTT